MPHNLSIVLVTPEIPTNTGSIGRLCLATNSTLHLVDPIGFEINDARVKRAGLDYWKYLQMVRHKNLEAFFDALPPKNSDRIFFNQSEKVYFRKTIQKRLLLNFWLRNKGLGGRADNEIF